MRLSKLTKITSALIISTAMVALPKATYGLDALKKQKEEQVRREKALRGQVVAHAGVAAQFAALDTFKIALENPSAALADGQPLDVALRAASADAGNAAAAPAIPASAAHNLIPAAPQATVGHKINALRALEASAVAGDAAHKVAIRTALGLHATGAAAAAVTTSVGAFANLAAKVGYFENLREGPATLAAAMGQVVVAAAAGAAAGDASHGMPTGTAAQKVAIINALLALGVVVPGPGHTAHDRAAINALNVALGINGQNAGTAHRLLQAYAAALG